MITCGDFMYEEGAGLEPDEVAEYGKLLGLALSTLPGGGLGHGCVVSVQDNAQSLSLQLVITHQVRACWRCSLLLAPPSSTAGLSWV